MSTQGRALVLGGGGVAGIAWEVGLLAGLADAGVDLREADLIVGTSAGAVVGAQLRSGADYPTLFDRQVADTGGERAARMTRATMARFGWSILRTRGDDEQFRRRMGALALAAEQAGATPSEAERLQIIASRLLSTEWPERPLRITAVDAQSGEFRVFDRDSGVPLLQAVAASCAVPGVWPPVTIDGRRYIDGGMRSSANADLAQGYERIVVLAPVPRGVGPMASVDAQVTGMLARVAVAAPDVASRKAFGRNALDPATRVPAARAGRAQAAAVAEEIAEVWGQ